MLTVIVSGFFGDEGKGKIAAFLALKERPKITVRTGSVNAGH
ncbi:MAG: adenylosuccinate synthetase, partial [Thermoproteota archaeon]